MTITRSDFRILGIVVAYRPDPATLNRLLIALYPQVDELLVVDNTPMDEQGAWDVQKEKESALANVRYVCLGENLGIAAAFNIGLECMLEEGFDYGLLSDQDSVPEEGMVPKLVALAEQLSSSGKIVGSVCPQYVDRNTNFSPHFKAIVRGPALYSSVDAALADPWIELLTNISSGSLVTRNAIEQIGGMKEELFIDYVDIEWCLRARSSGFRHYGTSTCRLSHQLGDGSFPVWAFGWRNLSLHSPDRLYYRSRNYILVSRMRHTPFQWFIRATWYWLGSFYSFSIFAPNRKTNIKMMLLGLWHGLRGRSGKYG